MITDPATAAAAVDRIARQLTDAARVVAERLAAGATLWCVAPGQPSHARHVVVEFLHPVVVGTRAFPAVAVEHSGSVSPLPVLVEAGDVVLVIAGDRIGDDDHDIVGAAAAAGAEVIRLGHDSHPDVAARVVALPPADRLVAAEHAVRAYHVLWELVHVWLDHLPAVGGGHAAVGGDEATGFLYPFLGSGTGDPAGLAADLARSAATKWAHSDELRLRSLTECQEVLAGAAEALAARFERGGRLLAFGNGGSATDAEALVDLCTGPPWGRRLPARNLAGDTAVLSALANDIGVEVIFARPLAAHARPGDIAVGLSTSGGSANVLAAFAQARELGLATVGLSGYDGGAMASSGVVDHCLVVRSDSVHRIQEVQVALAHELWRAVQSALSERAAP